MQINFEANDNLELNSTNPKLNERWRFITLYCTFILGDEFTEYECDPYAVNKAWNDGERLFELIRNYK